jgi:hypothetical protein
MRVCLESVSKEAVVVYSGTIPAFTCRTGENHEKPQTVLPVSRPRLETRTSKIQVKSLTASPTSSII